jgi:hypothetical protein
MTNAFITPTANGVEINLRKIKVGKFKKSHRVNPFNSKTFDLPK